MGDWTLHYNLRRMGVSALVVTLRLSFLPFFADDGMVTELQKCKRMTQKVGRSLRVVFAREG